MFTSIVDRSPLNFYETSEGYHIQVALPGVLEKDIHIKFEKGYLSISGQRRDEQKESERRRYHNMEIRQGPFERRLFIGEEGDFGRAQTSCQNGILGLFIPKRIKRVVEVQIEEEKE